MKYISTTFAHGNGPFLRIVDLGLAINQELELRNREKMNIIVPLVYGDRQKRIMKEDFEDVIRKNPDLILFDELHGQILNELFFKTGHYQENLEFLLKNQPKLEEMLRNHLSSSIKVSNFAGDEKKVKRGDIAFEISHNPRVATGYENSFYTSIAYFSELLDRTIQEDLGFDPSLLSVVSGIARDIEADRNLHFLPEPFTFSYDRSRKKGNEIFTPPFIHTPNRNNEDIPEGMYVTVTGIDGLKSLFDKVSEFGMKLYASPFEKNIENADKSHGPGIISNPNIKYQFGRTGWSTVWLSHLTETPLITPAYTEGDDPEIFFNEKSVVKLGLASIFRGDPNEALIGADSLNKSIFDVNFKLLNHYKTFDGIDYTARVIVDFIEGKDISGYRKIDPVLNN